MSASPTLHYTSYGTITPSRRSPSLRSPPQDDAFSETGSFPSSDSPGTLHRGLSSRQVQMIAIGGTIGTGLFLGTGRSLAQGGPASMLICYSIVGFIVYVTLLLLGEMATQYPIAGECFSVSLAMVCRGAVLCIYHIPQFLVSCQYLQIYRVNRENSLLSCVSLHLVLWELILVTCTSSASCLSLSFLAYNLLRVLTSSSTPRILQCLCYQIFLSSLRIRSLVELLVQ
jgi:hypothetical protein